MYGCLHVCVVCGFVAMCVRRVHTLPSCLHYNTPSSYYNTLPVLCIPACITPFIQVFHNVTTVRAMLAQGLSSGLRNDAPDSALTMRQRWRLAEGKCAEYSFTLLSRFLNKLDEQV